MFCSDFNSKIFKCLLNINDNLIIYLSKVGESSPDGGGSLSSFVSKRMLMINPVNVKKYKNVKLKSIVLIK